VPDCDHCGAEFDDEDAYIDHLASQHEGELGRIERRRVENHDAGGNVSRTTLLAGVVGLVILGAIAAVFVLGAGNGESNGSQYAYTGDVSEIETAALKQQGNPDRLEDVERFQSRGRTHVTGSIDYERVPPLSGDHSPRAVSASFNEETPPLGQLVHSLEHGAVVIYYDPSALTPEARQSLQRFVQAHQDPFASVIVAPNPNSDPQAAYVLTAWRTRLYMDEYQPRTVYAFLSDYLGRGPENPVR